MRFRLSTLWFLLFLAGLARGQENVITELPGWMVHGSAGVAFPDGFMKRYVDDGRFTFYAEVLRRVKKNQPVFIGISHARTTFQRRAVNYENWIDGSLVRIREKTASRFASTGIIIRFQPEINWFLQPYVQGQVGWNYLYTNTKFRDRDENETFDMFNESRDSAIGYALQGGIQFVPRFWYARIDLRFSYFRNPAIDFLALDESIDSPVPIENFVERNAPISLFFIHLGGSYLF